MESSTEPVVCTTFMLPPDEAPLYEIRQMLEYILDVVNDFHLAIFSLKNSYSLADALDVMLQLREAMSTQCKVLQGVFSSVADSARVYSAIPRETITDIQKAQEHIDFVDLRTEDLVAKCRDADAGIALGSQYFRQVVERMYSALSSIDSAPPHEDGPRTFLFNAKNPKVAENLLQAFSRAPKACRLLADYYHPLNQHLQSLGNSVDSLHPTPQEVEIVGRLWAEHSEHAYNLALDLTDISLYMHKSEPFPLPSKSPYQSTSKALPDPYTKSKSSNSPPSQPTAANNLPQAPADKDETQTDTSRAMAIIPTNGGVTTSQDQAPPITGDKDSAPPEREEASLALTPALKPRPSFIRRIRKQFGSCTCLTYFQD